MTKRTPLVAILHNEIRAAGGRITFAQFMELCLYHPLYGYYNTERTKLGKDGDFYTSAHAGPVFARLLAKHFERLWTELGEPARFDLVELGAGDGAFIKELLPWLGKRFPKFAPHLNYTAVEQSPALRGRLATSLRGFGGRARILADLPSPTEEAAKPESRSGCVIANEFFDAFPFHILRWRGGRWYERFVSVTEDDILMWSNEEPSSVSLVEAAELDFDPKLSRAEEDDGRTAEIFPLAGKWMERIGNWLGRGEVLVVDYGHSSEEWQAGQFPEGSALAYRQHQAMEDLLANPGEQDLTAHVNFSQLVHAGERSGLRLHQQVSQEKFLMQLGEPDEFSDLFSDCASDAERQKRTQQLKTLILPQGMGGTFQVLQFRKGM